MKNKVSIIFSLLALLMVAAFAQTTEKSFQVPNKPFLTAKTISGNIQITAWDKPSEILVKATVEGKNVQPLMEQKDGRVYVSENRDQPGFFGGSSGSVNYDIFVPRSCTVEGKSISGNITIKGLAGRIDFNSVSGNIHVQSIASADIELASISGDATCEVQERFSAIMTVKSISGDVLIILSHGADAQLQTSTISGKITCPADKLESVEKKEGYGSSKLSGTFGSGTGKITLHSISGGITVR